MAKTGNEFGATTGRPRRCGWLDLVALKYAVQINGVTQLIMTKGDVLSGFDRLKICIGYNYNGEKINHFPYHIEPQNVKPIYIEFRGWKEDLTNMVCEKDFPQRFKEYITFIEQQVNVPITIISVGPDRKQTIIRESLKI